MPPKTRPRSSQPTCTGRGFYQYRYDPPYSEKPGANDASTRWRSSSTNSDGPASIGAEPLYWRLHISPANKSPCVQATGKSSPSADLAKFELCNIGSDPKEATDLKDKEPERFKELREQLLAHNTAVEGEGPDWWKRLTKDGAREIGRKTTPAQDKK